MIKVTGFDQDNHVGPFQLMSCQVLPHHSSINAPSREHVLGLPKLVQVYVENHLDISPEHPYADDICFILEQALNDKNTPDFIERNRFFGKVLQCFG